MHIGRMIHKVLKDKHISVKDFADMCHCDRTNMYRILKKENIDIALLRTISIKLNYNFFKDLSNNLDSQLKV